MISLPLFPGLSGMVNENDCNLEASKLKGPLIQGVPCLSLVLVEARAEDFIEWFNKANKFKGK